MKSVLFALAVMTAGFVGSKAEARPCVDGTVSFFQETDASNNDRQVTVARTCVNGRYYPRVSQPAPRRCEEGRVSFFSEPDASNNDRHITVARTCVNGRYYPYQPQPTPRQCKEGNVTISSEQDGYSDRSVQVVYVCRNGKYIRRGF